jgi:DNA-binding IclR family transcriptional regulator
MFEKGSGRTLKTTATSLRIIDLLREHDGLTLAELDELLDNSKSTLHSHLTTLHQAEYLVRQGDTYRLSLRFHFLGEYARTQRTAYVRAEDWVKRLAERTDEEALFTVPQHGLLWMIHGVQGRSAESSIDFRNEYYMHNTAAGKAILSEYSADRVSAILEYRGMPAETKHTITSHKKLLEDLDIVREQGYGTVDEEFTEGLRAVGTTVKDETGIVGGLSVGGPTYRIDESRLHDDLVEDLLAVVEGFESDLVSGPD